jgi:hypothetical protein
MTTVVLVLIGVAIVAWLLREGSSRRDEDVRGPEDEVREANPEEAAAGADDGYWVEAAALTSDGWAFVPDGDALELVPPGEEEETAAMTGEAAAQAPVDPRTGRRLVQWRPGGHLAAGDLIAARVVRGAPGVDPWRLEALGRDYDYRSYAFETEEAARTALELVEKRIVRPPRDEQGDPIPVGAEDFVVARRSFEETEAALAIEPEDEETSP